MWQFEAEEDCGQSTRQTRDGQNCFSVYKAALKRVITEHGLIVPNPGESLHAARTRVLLELSPEAIRSVTAGVVANCFLRVVTQVIPRAIALEER